MRVELVNTATGERVDLMHASAFRIQLGPLPPEVEATLQNALVERQRWRDAVCRALAIPAEFLRSERR